MSEKIKLGTNQKKTRLHKMLESDNIFKRSLGDLTLNIVKATGAEKRTKEKLEKIEAEQIKELNTLIDALTKHVIKYKICDRHLKKSILENKHRLLGTNEFFDKNRFDFIKQFNEFVRILKIYKGFCQYLNPKKLQLFVNLMFDGKLNNEDHMKYKDNFLTVNRIPICNLALEDSSEESSENCSILSPTVTDTSSDTSSDPSSSPGTDTTNTTPSLDLPSISRASEWGRQTEMEVLKTTPLINLDSPSSYSSSPYSSSDTSSRSDTSSSYVTSDSEQDILYPRISEASTIYKGKK